jgi:hypothetical protein
VAVVILSVKVLYGGFIVGRVHEFPDPVQRHAEIGKASLKVFSGGNKHMIRMGRQPHLFKNLRIFHNIIVEAAHRKLLKTSSILTDLQYFCLQKPGAGLAPGKNGSDYSV